MSEKKKLIQTKKLSLHKETMRVLGTAELGNVAGGISGSFCGNPSCCQKCNPTLSATMSEDGCSAETCADCETQPSYCASLSPCC